MKIEDVRVGMKVVPVTKTSGLCNVEQWKKEFVEQQEFLRRHGFLVVLKLNSESVILGAAGDSLCSGSSFNASDFYPAEIEVGDEVRVREDLQTGHQAGGGYVSEAMARLCGKTFIALRCNGSVFQYPFMLDGAGEWGWTSSMLDLVRKAYCIKPEAAKANEPKAPDAVRMETNAAGGTQSAIGWSIREYVAPSLRRVAAVAKHGLDTYGEGNYAKIPRMDNLEHAVRHITIAIEESHGLPIPPDERGEDHLAHAVCRLMMAMTNETKEVLFDD